MSVAASTTSSTTPAGFGNDVITSFDATGGTAATQDLIDLSGLGITAANFATRVTIQDVVDAGTDDTLVTVRDASNAVIGTIFIEEVDGNDITTSDFMLAVAGTTITGNATGQTHNGTAGNDTINALGGNDTVNGNAGNDIIAGGTGNDTLNGDDGDDTFTWNANNATATSLTNSDGRDVINGGAEGAAGDIFVITGNAAAAETYRIYTRDAFDAVSGNTLTGLNAATEIVITRGGTNAASIIAELREIEEIRINTLIPPVRLDRQAMTRSRSSATSPEPACASTPSRSTEAPATTRSTSRRSIRHIASSSGRRAVTTPSSERCVRRM